MILETGTMRLISVREARRGGRADVLVCTRAGGAAQEYYAVWIIKDSGMARQILTDFCRRQEERPDVPVPYLACFFQGSRMCFSFPYEQERPLRRFYSREAYDAEKRQKIRLGLIGACMASGLPDSLLYLMLVQDQIRLDRDGSVRIQYMPDLDGYDPQKDGADCIAACVDLLLDMLEAEGRAGEQSRMLIELRQSRGGYSDLRELYQDVKIAGGGSGPGGGYKKKFASFFVRHEKRLIRILAVVCGLLLAAAVLMAVSQAIWGEIPLLRLFDSSFQTIGTESLLQ